MDERIVSIALLTRSDLKLLGEGFDRHFPVENDEAFSDLLGKLEMARMNAKPEPGPQT